MATLVYVYHPSSNVIGLFKPQRLVPSKRWMNFVLVNLLQGTLP